MEQILLFYLTFAVAVASPGPANFAMMHTALEQGRFNGMALALGVWTGSITWGLSTSLGLSAIMQKSPIIFDILLLAGGSYMFYMGFNSAKQVINLKGNNSSSPANDNAPVKSPIKQYIRGLLIHLTNPKAATVWLTIVLYGTTMAEENGTDLVIFILPCFAIAAMVMSGYVLFFSSRPMIALYARVRKPFTLTTAAFFIGAGLFMLYSAWEAFR
ncbi:LysE family translocator [Lentilitoribacter sp. Alg239-R112]|jgi:threonine/homoserine/homoserine lactone efflux protein|uniref:LysE family translocator n=1 Tax=Lentilitoribacter sp. Alg239-R112 TaxID=2305987 RepID=UPI0013A6E74D|nr:LysE family translocator [Lentilitoribacter sp. Alg239-R112]